MANNNLAVKLSGRPTAFMRLILRWWALGMLVFPFVRFMPVTWLIDIETEVVHNG